MNSLPLAEIISTRTIVTHGDTIALLRRASDGELKNTWELPGGKHDNPHEHISQAALREVHEETGIRGELLSPTPEFIEERIIGDGKHRGKNYRAYGFILLSESQHITLSTEHSEYTWLPSSEAMALPNVSPTSLKTIQALASYLQY